MVTYATSAGSWGWSPPRKALGLLIGLTQGHANAVALAYRASLVNRGLKSATIGRRLAAIRSAVKMARTVGRRGMGARRRQSQSSPLPRHQGSGLAGWEAMLDRARRDAKRDAKRDATREPTRDEAKGVRDLAIIRLLHDLGLRRGELVALDLADVNLEARERWPSWARATPTRSR